MKKSVSATPITLLNRIWWNFVVMKNMMCKCAYMQTILVQFFSCEIFPFWTYKFRENKILLKKFVNATPLKPLNRIWWNFFSSDSEGHTVYIDVHICREFWFIVFLWVMPLLNFRTSSLKQDFVNLCAM